MPCPPVTAVQCHTAFVRSRLPWLMWVFGLLLALTLAGQAGATPFQVASTAVDRISALPDGGHPDGLPGLAAIPESGTESTRNARPRSALAGTLPMQARPAPPSRTFQAAATDTRLRHALERQHRYPQAPYLLIHRGHAPPRA